MRFSCSTTLTSPPGLALEVGPAGVASSGRFPKARRESGGTRCTAVSLAELLMRVNKLKSRRPRIDASLNRTPSR